MRGNTLAAAIAVVALLVPQAIAQQSEEIRLQQMLPRYSEYMSLAPAERDTFSPAYRLIAPEGGSLPRFWLEAARGRVDIPVNASGFIDLRVVGPLFTENPIIRREPENARVRLNMQITPVLPAGLSVAGDVLRDSVADTNRAIGRFAGMAALLAPRAKGINIHMPEGAAAPQVRLNNGQTEAIPADRDTAGVYILQGRQLNRAQTLVLPVAATRFSFEF
jgi:hypothetical protein